MRKLNHSELEKGMTILVYNKMQDFKAICKIVKDVIILPYTEVIASSNKNKCIKILFNYAFPNKEKEYFGITYILDTDEIHLLNKDEVNELIMIEKL